MEGEIAFVKSCRSRRCVKPIPIRGISPSILPFLFQILRFSREINQRFTKLESSIVTLAESIAKLSAQIQMQRVIKDDVYHLRQEVAELRQQVHHQYSRQPPPPPPPPTTTSAVPSGGRTSSMSTASQQPTTSRLISANVQRLATANSTNPLNISTSYMPSTSTIQRSNSIIDPKQARKIEQ